MKLNERKSERPNSCQYAKHAKLCSDLIQALVKDGAFNSSGLSTKRTLRSVSQVPHSYTLRYTPLRPQKAATTQTQLPTFVKNEQTYAIDPGTPISDHRNRLRYKTPSLCTLAEKSVWPMYFLQRFEAGVPHWTASTSRHHSAVV